MGKNGQGIEPVKNYLKLTKHARWAVLVDAVMGNPKGMNITNLAESLGVARKTIHQDMDDPEFMKFKDKVIHELVKSSLMMHAWKNITKKIVEKGDTNLSKWLIENFYTPPVEEDEDDNTDTIDQFESSNGEMTGLAKAVNDTLRKFDDQGFDL